MGRVKSLYHDEIANRCDVCGVILTEDDLAPCDEPLCPVPLPGAQFPDLTPANLGERFIDPAILDREVVPPAIEPLPSWWLIAAVAALAAAVIVLTWNGSLFG